jgi:hypothetical protein
MPSFRAIHFRVRGRDEPTRRLASLAAAEKANPTAKVRFGTCPFADQVALKLRERLEDVKHQLAARCGRINRFGDAQESDPLGLESGHQLDEVLERPPQPVEPPDRQHVARAERIVHTLQAGEFLLAATGRDLDDLLAPGPLQGVTLQVKILFRCRDSRIADDDAPPLAARVKKPVGIFGSGLFAIVPPSHLSNKENRRFLCTSKPADFSKRTSCARRVVGPKRPSGRRAVDLSGRRTRNRTSIVLSPRSVDDGPTCWIP